MLGHLAVDKVLLVMNHMFGQDCIDMYELNRFMSCTIECESEPSLQHLQDKTQERYDTTLNLGIKEASGNGIVDCFMLTVLTFDRAGLKTIKFVHIYTILPKHVVHNQQDFVT